MSPTTRSRREPKQARAHKRREAILDATARLLDRVGFAATSTNAVARESGASIGTVYEYFPNKEALFRALLDRYRLLLSQALAEVLAEAGRAEPTAVVEGLFEAFVAFYRDQPGYRELWLGSQLTELLMDTGARWGADFAEELAPALALIAPGVEPSRRLVVTRASLHLVSALVTAALQAGGDQEAALIAEARLALGRYLAPELAR